MRYRTRSRALDARQPEHMPGPSLDRIRELVNYLDHPERTYPDDPRHRHERQVHRGPSRRRDRVRERAVRPGSISRRTSSS